LGAKLIIYIDTEQVSKIYFTSCLPAKKLHISSNTDNSYRKIILKRLN